MLTGGCADRIVRVRVKKWNYKFTRLPVWRANSREVEAPGILLLDDENIDLSCTVIE